MNKLYPLFLIAIFRLFSSEEPWDSIQDICYPTIDEYKRIDQYLQCNRKFLDPLKAYYRGERLSHFLKFQLLPSDQTPPVFEKYGCNVTEKTKDRCILLYASGNGNYGHRARELLQELQAVGYSGHILMRIGGFPNTENGSLPLCRIPYAFKLSFFREAEALGFKEVLWLDLAIHPMTDLNMIFSETGRNGYFLLRIGSLKENVDKHLFKAAGTIAISPNAYSDISHISSAILGLNLTNPKALELLDLWQEYTEKVTPCLSWHPEELGLSAAAHAVQCQPFSWIGTILCNADEVGWLPKMRPTIQAYTLREE